jgi:hypothetical protein
VFSEDRHVLVKFVHGDGGPAAQRWMDLLLCEWRALETVRAAGIPAAQASHFTLNGYRFLEIQRFDRVGFHGRRGLISLAALDAEYLGMAHGWTDVATGLLELKRISRDDARRIRWLDAFGQLIGNTDRHFGNISFFLEDAGAVRLSPVYDMLPMVFAPQGAAIQPFPFRPIAPTAGNFDVWPDAARWAIDYWAALRKLTDISSGFREMCASAEREVTALANRI